jgi:hypothetical protein
VVTVSDYVTNRNSTGRGLAIDDLAIDERVIDD